MSRNFQCTILRMSLRAFAAAAEPYCDTIECVIARLAIFESLAVDLQVLDQISH